MMKTDFKSEIRNPKLSAPHSAFRIRHFFPPSRSSNFWS